MKKLIKRLSRVTHSPRYSLLVSDPHTPCAIKFSRSKTRSASVPEGHLPVYVGDEMRGYVVSAKLVNHPIIVQLLNEAAQEYGYDGALRIPCHVIVFEKVLEGLRLGNDTVMDVFGFSCIGN